MAAILSSRERPSPLAIAELPIQTLVGNAAALVSPSSAESSSDSSDLSDIAPDDGHEDHGSKTSEGLQVESEASLPFHSAGQLPLLTPSHLEASLLKPATAVVVSPHEKKTGSSGVAGRVIKTSNDDLDTPGAVDVDNAGRDDTIRQLIAELAEKDKVIEDCNMAKERLMADKSHLEDYTRRTMRKLTSKYQEALKNCKQDLQDAYERVREMERREASERTVRNRDEVERWQNLSDKKDQELEDMMDQKDGEIDNLRREIRELNEELSDITEQKAVEIDAANENATILLQTNKELEESLDGFRQRLERTKADLSLKTEDAYSLRSKNHLLKQQARQSRKEIWKLERDLQDHCSEMRERRKEWRLADQQLTTTREELKEISRRYAKLSADKENLKEKYRELKKTQRDAESARASKSSPNLCVVCQDESSSVAIAPCGHLCLCTSCSATYFTRQTSSPICRSPAQSTLKIYQ